MHLEILDQKRQSILPLLADFKESFYLAGGTALALQIGHRQSIDFDFFTQDNIDTQKLFITCKDLFKDFLVTLIQEEKNTLGILIENEIKISFMTYPYDLVDSFTNTDFFKLASFYDIGCMKLQAISSRAELKDYVDIYFILKEISLEELIIKNNLKHKSFDEIFLLKGLLFFEDINKQPIQWQKGFEVSFEQIKDFLVKEVKRYENR